MTRYNGSLLPALRSLLLPEARPEPRPRATARVSRRGKRHSVNCIQGLTRHCMQCGRCLTKVEYKGNITGRILCRNCTR
jgi:hypothetical protein